jgi:hypothetical protein
MVPEHLGGIVILQCGFRASFQGKKRPNTQIDMTRTIPAAAASDIPANPPLEAKVFVSPKAVFSVMSE